jgi:hypothetical protein
MAGKEIYNKMKDKVTGNGRGGNHFDICFWLFSVCATEPSWGAYCLFHMLSFFPASKMCAGVWVPRNGRCDEVRAYLEKSWNWDGRLGGFVGQLCTFPMTIRGMQITVVYGTGFH